MELWGIESTAYHGPEHEKERSPREPGLSQLPPGTHRVFGRFGEAYSELYIIILLLVLQYEKG